MREGSSICAASASAVGIVKFGTGHKSAATAAAQNTPDRMHIPVSVKTLLINTKAR